MKDIYEQIMKSEKELQLAVGQGNRKQIAKLNKRLKYLKHENVMFEIYKKVLDSPH